MSKERTFTENIDWIAARFDKLQSEHEEMAELLEDIHRNYLAASSGPVFATIYTNRFSDRARSLLERINA